MMLLLITVVERQQQGEQQPEDTVLPVRTAMAEKEKMYGGVHAENEVGVSTFDLAQQKKVSYPLHTFPYRIILEVSFLTFVVDAFILSMKGKTVCCNRASLCKRYCKKSLYVRTNLLLLPSGDGNTGVMTRHYYSINVS